LQDFLRTKEYASLGWVTDQNWRFSGPSVIENGSFSHNYGPHFPLKVYYSPEVVDWLCNGRQGDIPDGAMIMKAMKITFDGLDIRRARDGCMDLVEDPAKPIEPQLWAPMLKTSKLARRLALGAARGRNIRHPAAGSAAAAEPIGRSPAATSTRPRPSTTRRGYPTGSVLQSLAQAAERRHCRSPSPGSRTA
jgi:hypothetical protein